MSKYGVKLKRTGAITNFNALNDLLAFLESRGNQRKLYLISSNHGNTWEDAEWFYSHQPVENRSETEKSRKSKEEKLFITSRQTKKRSNLGEGESKKTYNPSGKTNHDRKDSAFEKGKSSLGIGSLLLYAILIWGGLTLCDIFITNIRFVENANLKIAWRLHSNYNGKKLWKIGKHYFVTDLKGRKIREIGASNSNSNQQYTNNNTQSAEDAIDNPDKSQSSDIDLILEGGTGVNIENNTKFNNIYSVLSGSQKDFYFKVITQYNPDPEGKQGKICGSGYSTCKWCNSEISYEKYYYSRVAGLQSYVSANDLGSLGALVDLYGNPTTQKIVGDALMSSISGNKPNISIAKSVEIELDKIRNNDLYYCVGSGTEFCSEKCKYQYKWAHGYK